MPIQIDRCFSLTISLYTNIKTAMAPHLMPTNAHILFLPPLVKVEGTLLACEN